DPGDQFFRDLFRRADHYRPTTANSGVLRDFPHRPYPVRIGKSEGFERRSLGVLPAVADRLVESVLREIDTGTAGHQHQRAFLDDIGAVILKLLSSGLGSHYGDHGNHLRNLKYI